MLAVTDPGQLQGAFASKEWSIGVGDSMNPDDALYWPVEIGSVDLEPGSNQSYLPLAHSKDVRVTLVKELRGEVLFTGSQFKSESNAAPVQSGTPERLFQLRSDRTTSGVVTSRRDSFTA